MPQFKIFRSIHYWWHYAIWKMKLQLHVVDNSQIEKSDSLWSETQWNLRRTNKSSIFGRRLTDFLFLEYLLMTPLTLITPLILVTLFILMTLLILMTPLTLLILLKPNPTQPNPTQPSNPTRPKVKCNFGFWREIFLKTQKTRQTTKTKYKGNTQSTDTTQF